MGERYNVAHNPLGTVPNVPLASAPGKELYPLILIILAIHGVQVKRYIEICVCMCYWPTVRGLCPNYYVVEFQPWTLIPLQLGYVAYCYIAILDPPRPLLLPTNVRPGGGQPPPAPTPPPPMSI